MSAWKFNAPGNVHDFKDPSKWHDAMEKEAKDIIRILVGQTLGKDYEDITPEDILAVGPELAYVDPTVTAPPADAETIGISPWGAFPRAVERNAPWPFPPDDIDFKGNFRASEQSGNEDIHNGQLSDLNGNPLTFPVRHRQDEYLEWTVRRNQDGKITKAIFVAEGYDYYATLFENDPTLVRDMYREFTGINSIQVDELRALEGLQVLYPGKTKPVTLVEKGGFNWRNGYNIDPGIVHLSHRANSLGAEVNLAGVSGIARKGTDGNILKVGKPELLLCCSNGGNPNRNSDPLIGEQAYAQVLAAYHYTLADPVGLYIAAVEEQRLTLPNGEPIPREWWKVVRGSDLWIPAESRVLRLELEVPASEGLILADLLIDGNPVVYGAQLAQLLSVHLFVTRWKRTTNSVGPVVNCECTCCRKTGTKILVLNSTGACVPGYELAFEGLLPKPKEIEVKASAFKSITRL
ncbi:hypothetical protein G7074_03005 [Pedobacter sp. HDW13]|uniref:hypothetical protein n=1 Tax=Pedobacter sp. HDW13 TaxID=2714940 RepID=UPI001407BCDC|nr:hypothetical protein [Pedobacter sp. HDW13]QIL38337.1 hypothetical protein G7074_03005 [Pedobacter sp. HDW13]